MSTDDVTDERMVEDYMGDTIQAGMSDMAYGFDTRKHMETYFSNKEEMIFADDSIKFPMESLHHAFNAGYIKGDRLIDISNGAFIHHIYSASRYFKQICVLRGAEKCIMELNRWINKCTGEFDWSHIFEFIKDLEENSDLHQGKDITLKSAIAEIKKCDFEKENLIDPEVLPPADCVITAWLLELISKDKDEYRKNFRKFVKLLKPKGNLIILGLLNTPYMMVGQNKLHVFKYDENFVRQVLTEEGFIIDHWASQKRCPVSDLIDTDNIILDREGIIQEVHLCSMRRVAEIKYSAVLDLSSAGMHTDLLESLKVTEIAQYCFIFTMGE
ncbi:indolethylamine N-methyltransferase-like [Pseudophryne corroboree]|uniref:indolethylamine N-methyltransferase-like n=1 Tax=Pseudophryne corroboree TaxID=495146 RepID=UPI003081532E